MTAQMTYLPEPFDINSVCARLLRQYEFAATNRKQHPVEIITHVLLCHRKLRLPNRILQRTLARPQWSNHPVFPISGNPPLAASPI